jgi:hypothetical protein
MESALQRRILDAFDEKSNDADGKRRTGGNGRRRRGPPGATSSLSLADIQEMDLDRIDDDGRASVDEMLLVLRYLVIDEADRLLGSAFKDDMDELLSLFPRAGSRRERKGDPGGITS